MRAGVSRLLGENPQTDGRLSKILSLIHMPASDRLQAIAQARQALLHEPGQTALTTLAPWLQRGW